MLKLDLSKVSSFLPQDYQTSRVGRLEKAAAMLANPRRPRRGLHRLGVSAPGL